MKNVDQDSGELREEAKLDSGHPGKSGGSGECYNCGEVGHLSRDCPKPRQERGPGASDQYPEQFSIHKGEVAKLNSFGAFISLPGFRKNGLLHISQISNSRVDAEDLPHILEVGQEVFVKVTAVDVAAGRYSLSMKLCSQSDGRDLDPTHVEAQSDADRKGSGGGGGRMDGEPRRDSMAALQVPEYGGKQLGTGEYALLPDEDPVGAHGEREPQPPPENGKYNLVVPSTGRAPPPPPPGTAGGTDARAELQLELTARLLAKGRAKEQRRKEKREQKKEKKEKRKREKREKKRKKEKGERKSHHKHKKEKTHKRPRHDR